MTSKPDELRPVADATTDYEYRKILADRQLRDARRRREFAAPSNRLDVGGIDNTPDAALAVASAAPRNCATRVRRDDMGSTGRSDGSAGRDDVRNV